MTVEQLLTVRNNLLDVLRDRLKNAGDISQREKALLDYADALDALFLVAVDCYMDCL